MDDSRFSGSRSEGMALQKFAREREIGIDVEKIRPQSDLRKMAQRLFSAQEHHSLNLAFRQRTMGGGNLGD